MVSFIDCHLSLKKCSPFNGGKFEGWGTSFCWWPNRIGYLDELSEQAAKLFFDPKEGLGLNIIRYNIGGGDDPTHHHITRTDSMVPGYAIILHMMLMDIIGHTTGMPIRIREMY